jgi:two-component system sensor histidine kinase KdpD
MNDNRPNPDSLLARVVEEESRVDRGKLRIFFGYAAGVGKTFAMLSAAQREKADGRQVVVGYVEPHGRPETEALLAGLETLRNREVLYRGVTLREFDLDAALELHPDLILVDELAHTNVEGSRHAKRWQDVEELLAAGIDVWTTLNVQHIESLNDVIAQITGVVIRETLPDAVLEKADEIELVDLTPEELVERLHAGKVYLPQQAAKALQNFFLRGNLVALRELSLRQAANRLQRDVEEARQERAVLAPWLTTERLLVCVGPSPSSAQIIRSTKRLAVSLGAEWLAVAVNTGVEGQGADRNWAQTGANLRLAEKLGAETHVLIGTEIADAVIKFSRERNVSKIVVGQTALPWWKRRLFGTIVDELLSKAANIDVYVVAGLKEESSGVINSRPIPPRPWQDYFFAGGVVSICTALGWAAHQLDLAEANIVMIFLAGVALVASRSGRGSAIAAALASVLLFDFCFVQPYLTFAVSDTEYIITFAVMLGIGLLISALASRQRNQLRISQQQEHRTGQLFRMTRQLSELSGTEFLLRTAGNQLRDIFDGEVVIYVREPNGKLEVRYGEETTIAAEEINCDVAHWVADNRKIAGAQTDTLPNATALFAPLVGSRSAMGAIGIKPRDDNRFLDPDQIRLFDTCTSLIALSLERDESMLAAHEAKLQIETEKLRSSLLSAVSHDLRTPLASIAGASSTLATAGESLSPETRAELLGSINDEAERLSRLVENLLHMTRLSSGKVQIERQWHPVDEIIGSALTRLERQMVGRRIETHIDESLPMIKVDSLLIEQLLVNLLDNAAKYSDDEHAIGISAHTDDRGVVLEVSDRGRGFQTGDEDRVFELFYRGNGALPDQRGTGIGLAICKAIAEIHGGSIMALNRSGGGATLRLSLPNTETPPQIVERPLQSVPI